MDGSSRRGRAKSDKGCCILEMRVTVLTTYKKSIGTNNGSSSNAECCIIIKTTVGLHRLDLGESSATGAGVSLGWELGPIGRSFFGGLSFLKVSPPRLTLCGVELSRTPLVDFLVFLCVVFSLCSRSCVLFFCV